MEIAMSTTRRSIVLSLVIIASLCACRTVEASVDTDSSSSDDDQQKTNLGELPGYGEMSDFMERSGNLFFAQQPVQGNTASVQNANQLLPYFPQGGSQIYPDYTAQSTGGAAVQSSPTQIFANNNARQMVPQLAQGNIATGDVQNNNAQHAGDGGVHRTGNYGGYVLQNNGYVKDNGQVKDNGEYGRTEYIKYEPVKYEPVVKEVKVGPSVGVGVKLEPFAIIRALLRAIPRPLLNLNGKVFFGVELGNKIGLVPKQEVIIAKDKYY